MGCGASSTRTSDPVAQPVEDANGKGTMKNAQLKKVNSQLGKKEIMNSFVVQKSRSRRRGAGSDTGEGTLNDSGSIRKTAVERESLSQLDEPLPAGPALQLPAEAAAVHEPQLQGVSVSGPSFKMARGSQARLLNELQKDKLRDVATYKPKLYSNVDAEVLEGVTYFREQLSVVNPPVAAIRQTGILPRLVYLLKRDDNRALQYEVAWTLTNICSSEHEDCQDVVDQNAVPEFVRLLGSCDDSKEVLEQAIWALGNIAADSKELQKHVLDEEVVTPLLAAMARNAENGSLLRHSAWLLSNLARPRPQSSTLLEAVPTLSAILVTPDQDPEVITHSCWALAYITSEEQALDDLCDPETGTPVVKQLVSWVGEATHNATTPALRVLGNMCSGTSKHTQAVVDAGGIGAMLQCLQQCGRLSLKKEVIWSLSNVAAGTSEQVDALLKAGVFPATIALMRGSEESVRRECTYVLANPWAQTVGVAHDVAEGLLQAGLVQELVGLLDNSTPSSILVVVVEGLQDAIKRGQQMMMAKSKERKEARRKEAEEKAAADAAAAAAAGENGSAGDANGEEGATAAPPPPPELPEEEIMTNPVAEVMKAANTMDRLASLLHHEDTAIVSKVNGIRNMLMFL